MFVVSDGEGKVGKTSSSASVSALCIEENGVAVERIRFPFPPESCGASRFAGGVCAFEHESFDELCAGGIKECGAVFP